MDVNSPGVVKITAKFVMLFKAQKENEEDHFVQHLEKAGFKAVSIPVLAFKFVNREKLASLLKQVSQFSAIIFTSPRAVEAVKRVLESIKDSCDSIPDITSVQCYVVGKSTGAAAIKAGFNPKAEEAGNATELAKIISQNPPQEGKPFLYPCANIRRDTLVDHMRENDLQFVEVTAYETCPHEALESSVIHAMSTQGLPEYAVFFSPSGVQYTENLVTRGILPLQKLKVLALGPATKKELLSAGYTLFGVAAKPEPGSLVQLLQQGEASS